MKFIIKILILTITNLQCKVSVVDTEMFWKNSKLLYIAAKNLEVLLHQNLPLLNDEVSVTTCKQQVYKVCRRIEKRNGVKIKEQALLRFSKHQISHPKISVTDGQKSFKLYL